MKIMYKAGILFFVILIMLASSYALSSAEVLADDRILRINVKQSSSLEQIITTSGYALDNENIASFLSEFVNLNPAINSLSNVPFGSEIILPLSYLKKVGIVRAVKTESSLDNILASSEYVIDDQDVAEFLAEFVNLNPAINSLSSIPGNTEIVLPAAHLKKKPPTSEVAAVQSLTVNNLSSGTTTAHVIKPVASPDARHAIKTEMGRFVTKETAESFLRRLSDSGYNGSIEQIKGSNGQTEYIVFVLLSAETAEETGSDRLSWSVLGTHGKNIHAALTLTGIFTDNASNTKDNRKSDFTMILTPEAWLNFPRTDKAASYSNISPRSAGGHVLDSLTGERLFGYQASLYYRTDIPLTTSKGSPYGDTPTHKVAAGIDITGNKLSLHISDQFEKSYQEREAGQIIKQDTKDRYDANRFTAAISYDTRNRLIFGVEYVNFMTDFRSLTKNPLNRKDYGLTPSLRYRLSPKINLLAEYTYYSISYDSMSSLDSKEHYLLGGLEWRLTEKSFGRLKAGFESKDFENGSRRYNGYSFELQMEQRMTPKSQLSLSAYRKTSEARISGTTYTVTTGARLVLSHMMTSRITAAVKLSYINDKHRSVSPLMLSETVVTDHIYQGGVEVQYEFRRWLKARIEYIFTLKNSSDPILDYRSNTLLFGLTGSF